MQVFFIDKALTHVKGLTKGFGKCFGPKIVSHLGTRKVRAAGKGALSCREVHGHGSCFVKC